MFKRFATENGCRFGEECSYQHKISVKSREQNELKDQMEQMATVIKELVFKVNSLESELNNVKKDKYHKTTNEDLNKDKDTDQVGEGNTAKPLDVTKDSETLKDKPDEIHQREFKCDECEYIYVRKLSQ